MSVRLVNASKIHTRRSESREDVRRRGHQTKWLTSAIAPTTIRAISCFDMVRPIEPQHSCVALPWRTGEGRSSFPSRRAALPQGFCASQRRHARRDRHPEPEKNRPGAPSSASARQSEARRSIVSADWRAASHSTETALPQASHSNARTSGSVQLRGKIRRSLIGDAQKSQSGEVACIAGFLGALLRQANRCERANVPSLRWQRSQLKPRGRSSLQADLAGAG
jgi:hypothetical protein